MSKKGKPKYMLCTRCGIPRKVGRRTTTLCQDCKYVMGREGVKAWEKKTAA